MEEKSHATEEETTNEMEPEDRKNDKRGIYSTGNVLSLYDYNNLPQKPDGFTINTIRQEIPVPVPRPYTITVNRPYPVQIPQPYPVDVPRAIHVPVPQPFVVQVPKPYAITNIRPVPYEVPFQVPYPVAQPVKVDVPTPYTVSVPQIIPVKVPQPVVLDLAQPVYLNGRVGNNVGTAGRYGDQGYKYTNNPAGLGAYSTPRTPYKN